MNISCNDEFEDMNTNMCCFSQVLFKMSLLKEFSQVTSITGSIVTVVYVEITQYWAIPIGEHRRLKIKSC